MAASDEAAGSAAILANGASPFRRSSTKPAARVSRALATPSSRVPPGVPGGDGRSLRPGMAGGHRAGRQPRRVQLTSAAPAALVRCGGNPPYRFFAAFFAVVFLAAVFFAAGAFFAAAFLATFFAILPPWWRYSIWCVVIDTSLQVD